MLYVPSSGCGACSTSDLLTASRRTTGLFSGPARSIVGSVVDLDDTVMKQHGVGNAAREIVLVLDTEVEILVSWENGILVFVCYQT